MNQTITYLLRKVEAKYGQRPQTPGMFDMLALDIKKTCGQPISASTLKRVWGYVQSTHEPSLETLSLLARYVGSHDWNEFRQTCSESGFINRPVITADLIPMGQLLRLSWQPDHHCVVEHQGDGLFLVKHSEGSKLSVGDTFHSEIMGVGLPLYAHDLIHNGIKHKLYVAGAHSGLQDIVKIDRLEE